MAVYYIHPPEYLVTHVPQTPVQLPPTVVYSPPTVYPPTCHQPPTWTCHQPPTQICHQPPTQTCHHPPTQTCQQTPFPPLAVMQTRDEPLTPTTCVNTNSEKRIGKLLSCYTKNMEMVWHGEFNRLFQYFLPSRWYLSPSFDIPSGERWLTFTDSAKVRFLCKSCSHGWTSMKGRVVFWFVLEQQMETGIVFFRLFGQRCQWCSSDLFEHAMWYPEEVVKVIGNLFNRVGQEYYGFFRPPVRVDRRGGKPTAKHNSQLCQACCEGVCPSYKAEVSAEGQQLS